MSPAQRLEITRLREVHDGATLGAYTGDALPPWDRGTASREIDKLRAKIEQRKKSQNVPYKCPFCGKDCNRDCPLQRLAAVKLFSSPEGDQTR